MAQAAGKLPEEVLEMDAEDYLARVKSDSQFAAAYDFKVEISDSDNLLGLEQKVEEPAPETREEQVQAVDEMMDFQM